VEVLFIINGENESYKEDQYRIVGTMKNEKLKIVSVFIMNRESESYREDL
jgi:hypothetical protein